MWLQLTSARSRSRRRPSGEPLITGRNPLRTPDIEMSQIVNGPLDLAALDLEHTALPIPGHAESQLPLCAGCSTVPAN